MPRRRIRVRSHVRHTAQGRVVVDAHTRNMSGDARNRASKISTVGYTREGYPVYGAAYPKTYNGPFLTHSINRDLEKSLCRRVRFEHVIDDDYDMEPEPSCSVCRARLGLPETGANQAQGFHPKARTVQLARGLSPEAAYRSVPAGEDFRGITYNPTTGKARII